MAADPGVLKRLNALETRVKALELRAGDRQLARITDDPPTVQGAFALRRILEIAPVLARPHLTDSNSAMQEAAGEILSLVEALA